MSYLRFNDYPGKSDTTVMSVVIGIKESRIIGDISFYQYWNKYVFFPVSNVILDNFRMDEIKDKIEELTRSRNDCQVSSDM